jgi:hypothetical protein
LSHRDQGSVEQITLCLSSSSTRTPRPVNIDRVRSESSDWSRPDVLRTWSLCYVHEMLAFTNDLSRCNFRPHQLDLGSEEVKITIEHIGYPCVGSACLSGITSLRLHMLLESTKKLSLLFWTAQSSIHDSAGLALPSLDSPTPQVKTGG